MSKLSGWSMLWISLSITCIIATVFQLIQAKKSKKETGESNLSEAQLKALYDTYVYSHTHGIIYLGEPMSYEEWLKNRNETKIALPTETVQSENAVKVMQEVWA